MPQIGTVSRLIRSRRARPHGFRSGSPPTIGGGRADPGSARTARSARTAEPAGACELGAFCSRGRKSGQQRRCARDYPRATSQEPGWLLRTGKRDQESRQYATRPLLGGRTSGAPASRSSTGRRRRLRSLRRSTRSLAAARPHATRALPDRLQDEGGGRPGGRVGGARVRPCTRLHADAARSLPAGNAVLRLRSRADALGSRDAR
jgi:hypothetical protein